MSFVLSTKLLDARLRQVHENKMSRELCKISLVISLFIDGEDVPRLEPPAPCERPRSGLFIVEVTLRDTVSLDPEFTRLSGAAIRTILTNDPGLEAGHKDTNRSIDRFVSRDKVLWHCSYNRGGLRGFSRAWISPESWKRGDTDRFGRTITLEHGRPQLGLEFRKQFRR